MHPSEEAIACLRLRFEEAVLRKEEEKIRRLAAEILRMESHRPRFPWSGEAVKWQQHLEKLKAMLASMTDSNDGIS